MSFANQITVQQIDACLPQTQCRQCGFEGCLPYAEAIFAGSAPINRCPPGGDIGLASLANLTGLPIIPLDNTCGTPKPLMIAKVDESNCIGCTLCIQACPVDAIVGAAKHMHTIIADACTGCELCLPPCPTACIEMLPAKASAEIAFPMPLGPQKANMARDAHQARQTRLARDKAERTRRLSGKVGLSKEATLGLTGEQHETNNVAPDAGIDPRMAAIMAAMERAKKQLAEK